MISDRKFSGLPWPTGTTKVFAVIGDPIDHSLSPVLLNRAFTEANVDAVFVALGVSRSGLGKAMDGVRALGISGLSVTMPHKEAIIQHLDRVTDRSKRLGSVNCVFWEGGKLVGDSTDGPALVESLQADLKDEIAGRSVLILGTGGAARAIVLALADAKVKEVVVVGRNSDAVERVLDLGGGIARKGVAGDAAHVDIIINATSVGMADTEGSGLTPLSSGLIKQNHFVCDIIYFPLTTPLLKHSLEAGAKVSNGIGMLTFQAARAFTIWTGKKAPVSGMLEAANLVARGRAGGK
ncbi:MAG: shikimate dehydrogenase [Actinobacteria bacterium]|nr:shikimate dehydrogenase [Actinomycetota bacterium]